MNTTQRTAVILLALLTAALIGWRVVAWRTAVAGYHDAASFSSSVTEKAARVRTLRAQPAVSGFGVRPADDVIPLANRVLDAAAIPAARLRSLQPEADRAIADDRDGRRAAAVRLAIEPLTIPELGAFLAAWRSSQQVWSVSRIDLGAMSQGVGQNNAKASGNYRATITVTATYLDDQTPSSTPSTHSAPSTPSSPSPSPLLGSPQ